MDSNRKHIVIVGGGMAAARLIQDLVALKSPYEITLISEEESIPYNRIMLSLLLSGEIEFENTLLNSIEWYQENNIKLISGTKVLKIDPENKHVYLNNKPSIQFDKLVLCTGSTPFMPNIPGLELDGICGYRNINDVRYFLQATRKHKNAVVIGGGLLGLEAANGLHQQGMQVSIAHLGNHIMERQLDEVSANLLNIEFKKKGISIYTSTNTSAFTGEKHVESVILENGTTLAADLVIIAIGVRPSAELALDASLECETGIIVNDQMQTSNENIYAIGECVQHRGMLFGLVNPIYEQATICAHNLTSDVPASYHGTMPYTLLKVTGINVFSAGDISSNDDIEEIQFTDTRHGIFKKFFIKDDILRGAICYGDIEDTAWYIDLIKQKRNINTYRDYLAFSEKYINADNVDNDTLAIANSQQDIIQHASTV